MFSTALAVVSDYVLDFCLKRDFDDGSCSKTNEVLLEWWYNCAGSLTPNAHAHTSSMTASRPASHTTLCTLTEIYKTLYKRDEERPARLRRRRQSGGREIKRSHASALTVRAVCVCVRERERQKKSVSI